MKGLVLSTGYVSARLSSAFDLSAFDFGDAALSLPGGWELVEEASARSEAAHFSIAHASVSLPELQIANHRPLLADLKLVTSQVTSSLPYVLYTLLEGPRQQAKMLTAQAAAMALPNNESILILGDKGSGKTITAAALEERGCTHAGDDIVVLGLSEEGLFVRPGNRLSYRRRSDHQNPFYETKSAHRLDVKRFASGSLPVRAVFRLNVHSSNGRARTNKHDVINLREGLRLFENFSRYIRGVSTPFFFQERIPRFALPSMDDDACIEFRYRVLAELQRNSICYLSARSADDAADAILRQCQ